MPENVTKVLEVIHKNCKQMIHVVCNGTVVRDMPAHFVGCLNMKQTAAKFVPRLLTDDQKQHRLEVSVELKKQVRNDPDSPSKVIAGD